MTNLEHCFKAGLLKEIPPSPTEAANQMQKAKVLLKEAEECLENEQVNACVMAAYAGLFDSARALLLRDGYRERGSVCVVRYLEAKYLKELGDSTILLLDEYREKRHKVVYASDYYSDKEEAEKILSFACSFISKIEKILKTK